MCGRELKKIGTSVHIPMSSENRVMCRVSIVQVTQTSATKHRAVALPEVAASDVQNEFYSDDPDGQTQMPIS